MGLTLEELRMLANQEREMDSGAQPFVLYAGHRLAVTPEAMQHFGLVSRQTINAAVFEALLRHNVEVCRQAIGAQGEPAN